MPFTLTSHGAAGTVTGSKHLLELTRSDGSSSRILMDCGMFQGEALQGPGGKDRNRRFGFDPASVDVLVLSHAHIDHSGLIPRLVREGFRGPIYATAATRDLCAIMLEDSARIQEYDTEYDRKRAKKRGQPTRDLQPLYTVEDVKPAMALFQVVDINETITIAPGVHLAFTEAGHILGSAAIQLVLDDGERVLRLSNTADVGRYVERILPEPAPFPQADVILCESTYGDRDHMPIKDAEEELLRHVHQVCVEQQGALIIPAFSIGKTQEVLYTLNSLSNAGRLPRVPVFVDSPLAISATHIARQYPQLLREAVRAELEHDPDLFTFPGVEYVREPKRSMQLNGMKGPRIVIAASGMMEAGRVRHHLFHGLAHAENAVLAIGFCAPGTLGAALLGGAREVHIFGELVPVKAAIHRMEFYSAHADRNELLRYLACQDAAVVEKLILVHGIDQARESLRERCLQAGFKQVLLPRMREVVEL
ncbi:MAG: MBL fold metallo-hydrolase [Flavobacteriales bacterium]|nr:MBL fold metallo-hydrolase [Flavobacteriales bacterium]